MINEAPADCIAAVRRWRDWCDKFGSCHPTGRALAGIDALLAGHDRIMVPVPMKVLDLSEPTP